MSSVFGEDFDLSQPHDIQIRVEGDHHQVFVDGQNVFDFIDDTYDSCHAGVRLWNSPTGATIENIEVNEL